MKFLKKMHKGQKGFTLIELLIVIVILGVLAAAIIPNLSRFTTSGKLGAANAELAAVKTAITAYMSENNGTIAAATGVTGGAAVFAAFLSSNLIGTYAYNANGIVTASGTTYPYSGGTFTVAVDNGIFAK